MAFNVQTFITRTGSAIVFGIVMLAGLLWNEWAFLALVSLIQVLCLREYFGLMKKIYSDTHYPKWMMPAMQIASLLFLWMTSRRSMYVPACFFVPTGHSNVWLFLFIPIVILLATLLPRQGTLQTALHSFGGIFYIVLPMILLVSMRSQSIVLPLGLILMIWINDTMAYIVGSFIGKTPFSEISPKKTWEGTIGGALLTMAAAGVYGYFSSYYTITDWMALSLCAAVAGTLGDLLESKLKRMANVKDSGAIMPGHGGALDRFDSLLVATPFAFTYAYIFMPELPLVIF